MAKKTKKGPPKSPKGMRDIMGDEYYYYQGFFEKAQEIAVYYNFQPIETPILEKEEVLTSSVGVGTDIVEKEMYTLHPPKSRDKLVMRPEATAAIMRAYIEHGMQSLPQPVMLYHYGPFFRHNKPQRGRLREFRQFGLEILGTDKSIADALIVRIITTILEEAGCENLIVDINSIGDKECRPDYIRELTAYYRKHIKDLCPDCNNRIKINPLRLLDCKDEGCQAIKEDAPDSISFLCTACKNHFKEVLEYLEEMQVPYRINKNLVRGLDYYTRTVFEVVEQVSEAQAPEEVGAPAESAGKEKAADPADIGTDAPEEASEVKQPLALAGGGRYDYLAKRLGGRKDVPSVGASIGVDRIIFSDWSKKLTPRIIKKPKVYFIRLGTEAKLKSFNIIELLRKGKIPIAQSISKESIGAQLGMAEKLNIPYVIIFGQQEALENSVIVRDMKTRSQKTVQIEKLQEYLKKLK